MLAMVANKALSQDVVQFYIHAVLVATSAFCAGVHTVRLRSVVLCWLRFPRILGYGMVAFCRVGEDMDLHIYKSAASHLQGKSCMRI